MPFLDRLQRWADDRPDGTAVAVAGKRLDWAGLRDAAAARVPASPAVTVLAEPNSLDFVVSFAAAVAGRRRCAVLDPTWPPELLEGLRSRILAAPPGGMGDLGASAGLTDGPPDTPFLVGLTSGTTALPKAFSRSRRSWQVSFDSSIEFFGLTARDRTLAPGPLAASLNLYALAECLYAGSEFHALERFDVGDAHTAIAHDGITRLVLVPTMLRLLSERGLAGGVDASGLRSIICAGSKLDARTLEAARRWAPSATIFEYYGAAELSFVAGAGLAPAGAPASNAGPEGTGIGRAFPGVDIRILDGAGRPLPDSEVGNVSVRSGMVSDGYLWGDDGEALRCFDGWYTVGDQGYLADGILHLLGRRSDMINTSGTNVYPHEIELALASVPGVAAAVAAGAPDGLRGQRVVAAVLASHGGLTATQLRAGLEDILPRSKRPLDYYVVSELPLTDRGKPSRPLLLAWIAGNDPRLRRLG
ncbi:class I adenylate-forming enzyme family protein [Arthrobacter sp. Soil763]|uniref:class I adenylate-forming enzyme family protein n=1 Tax=Arthrobacter sp. Soil763 TaxID=1736402 RepID=UPI0006F9BACC|nr:AMP-binding protein [Arthrobacter sp. Soil763]KRE78580.1 AMP-dependent synthetase [Arthrobacter sp. Soil763]